MRFDGVRVTASGEGAASRPHPVMAAPPHPTVLVGLGVMITRLF
jgi:pyruvate dehydrogenase complex dehydrogenase (E1) component